MCLPISPPGQACMHCINARPMGHFSLDTTDYVRFRTAPTHRRDRPLRRPQNCVNAHQRPSRLSGERRNPGRKQARKQSGGGGRNRTGVHGFAGRCMTTLPPRRKLGLALIQTKRGHSNYTVCPPEFWSGKGGSNSRPQPWQGCALPTELFPRFVREFIRQPGLPRQLCL